MTLQRPTGDGRDRQAAPPSRHAGRHPAPFEPERPVAGRRQDRIVGHNHRRQLVFQVNRPEQGVQVGRGPLVQIARGSLRRK